MNLSGSEENGSDSFYRVVSKTNVGPNLVGNPELTNRGFHLSLQL